MNKGIALIPPADDEAACPSCGARRPLRLCYWPRGPAGDGKAVIGFACVRWLNWSGL